MIVIDTYEGGMLKYDVVVFHSAIFIAPSVIEGPLTVAHCQHLGDIAQGPKHTFAVYFSAILLKLVQPAPESPQHACDGYGQHCHHS